jgi:hypothetical protein
LSKDRHHFKNIADGFPIHAPQTQDLAYLIADNS